METNLKTLQNRSMNKFELPDLEDLAVELAVAILDAPTEKQIEAIYERLLVWEAERELGTGATTLH